MLPELSSLTHVLCKVLRSYIAAKHRAISSLRSRGLDLRADEGQHWEANLGVCFQSGFYQCVLMSVYHFVTLVGKKLYFVVFVVPVI